MAIRYDAELNREIRRAVSNYNKRVKRMLAQEGDLDIELVRVANLKKQFDKRRDLLYELSRMEMIRGDSSSIEKAIKRDIRRAKIKLNWEIKRVKEQEGTSRFTPIKSTRLRNLEARRKSLDKDFKKLGKTQLKTLRYQVDETLRPDPERLQKFYDNFFDMLFANMYFADYYGDDADYIKKQLSKLTPEQLLKAYNEQGAIHAIVDSYNQYTDEGVYSQELYAVVENLRGFVDTIVDEYKKQ